MSGLQTRTYTLAGQSFTAGTFVNISQLMGSTQSTTNPEGMTKVVRISLSATPQQDSATDGVSIFKFAGDGVSVQPVVMENSNGLFDIIAGNQIDFSASCTTSETCDVAISITYSA